MNICVFGKYNVHYVENYSYREYDDPDYASFATGRDEWTVEMDGPQLLRLISKLMVEKDTIDVVGSGGHVYITQFRPTTGEGSEIHIEYEEIEEQKENERVY